jgi:hypothetical protein
VRGALETEALGEPQHRCVLAQDFTEDLADALRAGVSDHRVHQTAPEAQAFQVAAHQHGVLGPLAVRIGGDPNDAAERILDARGRIDRDQRHLSVVVDLGEPRAQLRGQRLDRAEEAEPAIFLRGAILDHVAERRRILGPDRAQQQRPAIAQHERLLQLLGIGPDRQPGGSCTPARNAHPGAPHEGGVGRQRQAELQPEDPVEITSQL